MRITSLWCRDAWETRVAGGRTGPAMEMNMQDLIKSLTPICKGLDPKSSFPRISVPASAVTPTPNAVARLDRLAQLTTFLGEKFVGPCLRLAFLESRVLAIAGADPSHRQWARSEVHGTFKNIAALFCAWSAVRRLSLVPASAPEYMSSAPFTGYKSATKHRLLLDQRGGEWPRGAVTRGALRSLHCGLAVHGLAAET